MAMLDKELGELYAQALLAIARVDGEINPEEASRVRTLVAARADVEIDYEAAFFHTVTSDELAGAVARARVTDGTEGTSVTARELGRAFIADAVVLATADGDLNGKEAQAILRFAHALGCTSADIRGETTELDEYLS